MRRNMQWFHRKKRCGLIAALSYDSIKIQLRKSSIRRGSILAVAAVIVATMIMSSLAPFLPTPKAQAAGTTFKYTNSSFSAITGPFIGVSNDGQSSTYTYQKSSGDVYIAQFKQPDVWDGCTEGVIRVSNYGAGSGYAYETGSCSQGGNQNGQTISIQRGSTPAGTTVTGTWIDFSHISSGGNIYYDNQIDDNLNYQIQGGTGCSAQNYIDGFPDPGSNYANATAIATIHLFTSPGGGNNTCVDTPTPIQMSPGTDPANFNYDFVWQDQGTISTSDDTALIFTQDSSGSGPYYATSGRSYNSQCQSQITGASGWPNDGTLIIRNDSSSNPLSTGFGSAIDDATLTSDGQGCYQSSGIVVQIADPSVNGQAASTLPAGSSGVGGGGGASSTGISCNIGINGDSSSIIGSIVDTLVANPLNWLLCGIISGMNSIIQALDGYINSWLVIGTNGATNTDNPSFIFAYGNGYCSIVTSSGTSTTSSTGPSNTCDSYHTAWATFEGLALGLLAILTLAIVIAQALGMEILDAYTIRKMLPRVVAGAIILSISWPLMKFAVTLSNDLGYGVGNLLSSPFSGISDQIQLGGGNGLLTTFAASLGAAAFGFFGLLSFLGTAAIAVFVAFLTLIFRQIAVIMLIIFAPIAIICYALPNTQRVYKFWWESFSKLLLMFPMIVAMITIGHIFSAISSQNTSFPYQVIAFLAYFAPYFMIPLTFRFAGTIMGNIGNMVNNRAQGSRDRLSKYRGAKMAQNWEKNKNYSRLSNRNRVTRGINTALGAAVNPRNVLRGRAGIRAGRQSGQAAQGLAEMKDNAIFQNNQGNDNFLVALADENIAKQKLAEHQAKLAAATTDEERNKEQAEVDGRLNGLNLARQVKGRRYGGTRLAALNALSKTGFQFKDGAEGYQELDSMVRSIVGNDEGARATAMNEAQYNLRTAGRFELGGINNGAGYDAQAGLSKASLYELANSKPSSIKAMGESLGAGPVHEQHAVVYKELQAMLPNSKGAARDEVVNQMNALEARGVQAYMNSATGQVRRGRVTYDPARHAAAGWAPEEVARGWRIDDVAETYGDLAQRSARSYERPDPNNIGP